MTATFETSIRYAVIALLATAASTILAYLWTMDIVSLQRTFGALLGSELVIFSMIVFVYYKPALTISNTNWLCLGCVVAAIFLLIAVLISSP